MYSNEKKSVQILSSKRNQNVAIIKTKTKTPSPSTKLQNENPFPAVNHIASGKSTLFIREFRWKIKFENGPNFALWLENKFMIQK